MNLRFPTKRFASIEIEKDDGYCDNFAGKLPCTSDMKTEEVEPKLTVGSGECREACSPENGKC